jgi:PAS domain-containing protein
VTVPHEGGAVPHVELALIENPSWLARRHPPGPRSADTGGRSATRPAPAPSSFDRWAAAVNAATEPCLVLDAGSVIVAISASCAELIGLGDPAAARGRRLRDAVVRLVDFTDSLDDLDNAEADKIPPLLAISSGRLARGLIRLACPEKSTVSTMDAISTPLWDGPELVGSLTFFAPI